MADTELTYPELTGYRNQGHGQRAGKRLRFYCPVHGGDNQRSFSLDPATGFYKCFTCGAKGQLAEKKAERRAEWKELHRQGGGTTRPATWQAPPKPPEPEPKAGLAEVLTALQANLTPDSWGARYLVHRGIPLDLARRYGVGYAPAGQWPHLTQAGKPCRQWKWGRLVFPHLNPAGEVVNLYGRAVGTGDKVPKAQRHDHLPGPKGAFNAPALQRGTVFICEGVFDALALIVSGYEDTVAIFGVDGLRWEWVKARRVIFAFDQDQAGQGWVDLGRQGVLLGKTVLFLGADTYHGHKDLNEVLTTRGRVDLGGLTGELEERAAILEAEGLTRDQADLLALGGEVLKNGSE